MTKYQCYYNETIHINNISYIGKKVIIPDALFNTELEAEKYCRSHVGMQGNIENEINFEEIEV